MGPKKYMPQNYFAQNYYATRPTGGVGPPPLEDELLEMTRLYLGDELTYVRNPFTPTGA